MEAVLVTLFINLVPVAGAVGLGWSVFSLLILYWIENVVVGVINLVKILIVGFGNRKTIGQTPFVSLFFVFHYGLFCLVHGAFIWTMFGGRNFMDVDPFGMPAAVVALVANDRFLFWNVALLTAYQVYLFLRFWIGARRWAGGDVNAQLFAPYGRIVVVHLTVMFGGLVATFLGQPLIALVLLGLLKTALEIGVVRFNAARESPVVSMA